MTSAAHNTAKAWPAVADLPETAATLFLRGLATQSTSGWIGPQT